jgi:putative phage-type endonuclease
MNLQRTPEWYAARLGKATASRIADVVAKTKTGYSTSRQNYAAELIAERLTGVPANGYVSPAMQWGTDHETEARALYADRCGLVVDEAGFVDHPEVAWSGASPDGFVDADGLVEIKCPLTATHIDTLLGAEISGGHQTQMQWQMACTGRLWCDYVSYDPRLPPRMQLYVRRVPRDLSRILELETEVTGFLQEIETRVDKLATLYGQGEAA